MADTGTPVVAVGDGEVTSKTSGLGGLTVWLTASDGTRYYYAHLDTVSVPGGQVSAGDVLGTVGHTGNASASAPHLHFEIHPGGGAAVNPYPVLRRMAR
jgi:murein DD-endopeptidase MepM/ murein hydrolase activator NlpD